MERAPSASAIECSPDVFGSPPLDSATQSTSDSVTPRASVSETPVVEVCEQPVVDNLTAGPTLRDFWDVPDIFKGVVTHTNVYYSIDQEKGLFVPTILNQSPDISGEQVPIETSDKAHSCRSDLDYAIQDSKVVLPQVGANNNNYNNACVNAPVQEGNSSPIRQEISRPLQHLPVTEIPSLQPIPVTPVASPTTIVIPNSFTELENVNVFVLTSCWILIARLDGRALSSRFRSYLFCCS